ncbi:MAG: tetratricopeptide repeat protein [Elusimicrobiota bacterium]
MTSRVLFSFVFFPFLVGISQYFLSSHENWKYPHLRELVLTEYYSSDMGFVSLGARRLAADVGYIQFLQYYGVRENENKDLVTKIDEQGNRTDFTMRGKYPRLYELGLRYLRLDPFFNHVILEAGGALAFNQSRSEEALSYLREAIVRDPTFWRYHLYATAILYKNSGEDEKLISILENTTKYPDSPVLFKFVLANLFKKIGKIEKAGMLYKSILLTAPSESDRNDARKRIEKLLREHPSLAAQILSE